MSFGKITEKPRDGGIGMTVLLNGDPNIDLVLFFSFYEKDTQPFCKGSDLPALNFSSIIPVLFGMRIQETIDKKPWIELQ